MLRPGLDLPVSQKVVIFKAVVERALLGAAPSCDGRFSA
jgi:hypothetical protein